MSLRRDLDYEFRHLIRNFTTRNILVFVSVAISSVVIGLSDAQSFFVGDQSPIPQEWVFLKKPVNARIISIAIIVFSGFLAVSINENSRSKDYSKLAKDYLAIKLIGLVEDVKHYFPLSAEARAYIIMPTRQSFCRWKLKIISYTKNVESKELDALLRLDEGVFGYVLEAATQDDKYTAFNIELKPAQLPPGYKHLTRYNINLLRSDIVGFLIFPFFERNTLAAELVIDSSQPSDIELLRKEDLHRRVLEWLRENTEVLILLRRTISND